MNILLIGDPHFKVKDAERSELMCKEIIEIVKKNSYDFIVILGDILDTHEKVHLQPFTRAVKFIKDLSDFSKIFLLIGNHDRLNNSDFLSDIHAFTSFKNKENYRNKIIIIDKVYKENNFVFVPYVSNGRFKEALSTIDYKYDEGDIIFAHQEFKGCKMGALISENGDVWEKNLPLVFSGHIHNYQEIQKNIIYVGTPIQHSYGDTDDKCLLTLKINEEKKVKWNKIFLNIKKKRILTVQCFELENYKENENYETKLIIEGDGKKIRNILKKRKDIENYKIKDINVYKNINKILDKNEKFITIFTDKIKKNNLEDYFKNICV